MKLLTGVLCGVLCVHADINIMDSMALTENADWRDQGAVTIARGVTLDLAGHQLKLSGLAGEGTITDSTPLGDSELVSNGSFEAYEGTLLIGTWNQCSVDGAAQPTGWTFQTSDPSAGPGLGMSGSPWVGTAPDGTMVAYIQKDGLLTQTIDVPADGYYVLSFKYAARPYASNPKRFLGLRVYVEVDGAAIRYVKTTSTASSTVVVGIPLTAGEHTLALRGDSTEWSNDHCTWFDAVSLKPLSAACGELVIDVPEDAELVNNTVALTGNMKITKRGAGTYTAAKAGQTYVGGTVVEAGTLKAGYLGDGTSSDAYGWGSSIKVCTGATFDIDGWANVADLLWLDGGTVKNGTDRGNAWTTWIRNMILTADSTVEADESFTLYRAAVRNSVLTLGAFTLTMQIPKDRFFALANLEVRGNGRLLAEGGGCLHIGGGDGLSSGSGYYLRAREATLQVENVSIKGTGAELEVGNYIANHAGSGDDAAAALKVFGRFQPKTRWHNCELQDGATLDLSDLPGTWATVCRFSDGATGTAGFASDAAIALHLGARDVMVGDQLVEWRGQRPDSATFAFDEEAAAREVPLVESALAELGRSGLFYGDDQNSDVVIVAHWTGGGDLTNLADPRNWICTNMAGRVVANGVPNNSTSVHFAGNVEFQVPCGTVLPHYELVLDDIVLQNDCNWCGLGEDVYFDRTIDLKGHKLFVSALKGTGTITDSTPIVASELVSNGSFEAFTGTLLNGNWNQCSQSGAAQPTKWTFQTSDPNAGPGLGQNGSPWVATSPDGTMVAYIQKEGVLTQMISVPADGYYVLSFQYAARPYNSSKPLRFVGLRIYAELDGVAVHYVQTLATTFNTAVVGVHLTAGEHTLALRGDSVEGSTDHCTAIDAVSLKPLSAACGELVLDVPENAEIVNRMVSLTGNMKLTKRGAGTYTAAKDGQTYVGGTVVEAGTLKAGYFHDATSSDAYGWGSTIKVCSGATFDIDGWANVTDVLWLDGGTVRNSTDRGNAWATCVRNMTLTADSTVDAGESFGFFRSAVRNAVLTLGSYTLSMQIPQGRFFALANVEVRGNGRLLADGGGSLQLGLWTGSDYYVQAREATLEIENASLRGAGAGFEVRDCISNYGGVDGDDAAIVKVYGSFQPKSSWRNCELQDGATIDLTARTTPLDVGPDAHGLFFDEGAKTIHVSLTGRKGRASEPLLTWTTKPSVAFIATSGSPFGVVAEADGLYPIGLTIFLR